MSRRYGWIFAAMIAVLLLLAFFLWPQTPAQIGEQPSGATTEEPAG
ncbi:MAG TPA: hypothetical protein VFZ01_07755 [Geminicoccaceae bacterium]